MILIPFQYSYPRLFRLVLENEQNILCTIKEGLNRGVRNIKYIIWVRQFNQILEKLANVTHPKILLPHRLPMHN